MQAAFFQWQFHRTFRNSATRLAVFDAQYPELLAAAVASGRKPIYLIDQRSQPGYIQAYWHGTLRGMRAADFVRLPSESPAPAGSVVITTEENPQGQIIGRTSMYTLYLTPNQQ
jgi:hypothetical protein